MKGHQDSNSKASTNLPLLAQLNIKADKLAGQFQLDYGKFIPKVLLLPASPVILSLRGLSITSQYKHQLQRAYTEPPYISGLQEKNGWNGTTVKTFLWKELSIAIKRI